MLVVQKATVATPSVGSCGCYRDRSHVSSGLAEALCLVSLVISATNDANGYKSTQAKFYEINSSSAADFESLKSVR